MTSTHRILRLVTRLNTGGPTRYLVTLSGALDQLGYEQQLAAGREASHEGSMRAFVRSQGIEPIHVPGLAAGAWLTPSDILAIGRVRRLIRAFQPDIVETHMSKAGVVGRIAAHLERTPIVVHVYHGHVLTGYYGPVKTWMVRVVERALARLSDELIAVSAQVRDDLVEYGVAGREHISVIEPGLDLGSLLTGEARGGLRQELGLGARVPLVGFVGRLCPIKNPQLFLDAAAVILAACPDAHFAVVGDGELAGRLRAQARRLRLTDRTFFLGWRYDLARIYGDLDVLALTSNNEGLPLALIEAMAAGCPVVATRAGGVVDLIDDQITGLLVPTGAPATLAAAVMRLLRDRRFARELSDTARVRVEARFSAPRMAAAMDTLYRGLLGTRGARRRSLIDLRHEAPSSVRAAMGGDRGARL